MASDNVVGRDGCCELNVLCQQCEHVKTESELLRTVRKQTTGIERYDHHESYKSLHASAIDGCHLCSLGVAVLSAKYASLLQSCGSYKVAFRVWCDKKTQPEQERDSGWWNGRYCWYWASLAVVLSNSNPSQSSLEGSLYVARVVESPVGPGPRAGLSVRS